MEITNKQKTHERQSPQNSKSYLKRLMAYALYFKKELFFAVLGLGAAVILELVNPLVIRHIMDQKMPLTPIPLPGILKLLALYVALSALSGGFKYASGIGFRITAMKVVQRLRLDLYQKIQTLPVSYFENQPAGSIVSKITNDTNAVQNLYVLVLGQFLVSAGYVIGVYAAIFMLNPKFAAVVLLFIPFFYLIFRIYGTKSLKYNGIIRQKIGEINGAINEAVQGISIIQAFNSQQTIQSGFDRLNEERLAQEIKMQKLDAALSYNIINIVRNIAFMMLIYFFGHAVLKDPSNITTVGMLYVYLEYMSTLFQQTHGIFDQIYEISRSGAASRQIFDLMDLEAEEPAPEALDMVQGEVLFEHVSFHYKEGEEVLKDISIIARPGETIALVGHTGSGKSSVLNLLLKFYAPQKGRITIDGRDLSRLSPQAVRQHMGIVLQEPYLFSGTILSNITLDNPDIPREQALQALLDIGGEVVIKNLSKGIDEPVVEKGSTLSSGQRQLISFARAMAHNPKILILDEATSSIDSETEQIIQKATEIIMKGRTTFIIAHRLSTIKDADRIYLLDQGRILEEGSHQELMGKKGKYYKMYHTQLNMK